MVSQPWVTRSNVPGKTAPPGHGTLAPPAVGLHSKRNNRGVVPGCLAALGVQRLAAVGVGVPVGGAEAGGHRVHHNDVAVEASSDRAALEVQVQACTLPGTVLSLAVPGWHPLLGSHSKAVVSAESGYAVAKPVVATTPCRSSPTAVSVVPVSVERGIAATPAAIARSVCELLAVSSWSQRLPQAKAHSTLVGGVRQCQRRFPRHC